MNRVTLIWVKVKLATSRVQGRFAESNILKDRRIAREKSVELLRLKSENLVANYYFLSSPNWIR